MTAIANTATDRGHSAIQMSLATLRQRLSERRRQRQLRQEYLAMLDLDDHILRDIGVTRGQVAWAAQMPLSQDAEAEIDHAVARNRVT